MLPVPLGSMSAERVPHFPSYAKSVHASVVRVRFSRACERQPSLVMADAAIVQKAWWARSALCLRAWFWLREGVCWRVSKQGANEQPHADDAEQ